MTPTPSATTEDLYSVDLAPEDYQAAFTEVAFLLNAFARAIDNIMGGVTAPVGRIAGRDTAKKLPGQLADPTLEGVAKLLGERMQAGFDFTLQEGTLSFGNCVVRDVCKLRGFETGGALCTLFHAYLDGVMDGLLHRPVKSSVVSRGDTCQIQLETL
jgi:tetrahydromethanopterin S-methyltransferase subunit G